MKTRIRVKSRGAKVFDIVEIPDLESTRSVEHSDEKHSDSAIKNGKMPVQKRVENYAHD